MSVIQANFYSVTLSHYVDVNVYIPSIQNGFAAMQSLTPAQMHQKKQYPSLCLLHGLLDDHSSWMRFTRVEEYAEKKKMALIMPSGANSFYVNSTIGRYFDFINEELPLWAEANFPLLSGRENRYIAGLSMGGFGASLSALTLPGNYAAFATFSGAVDMKATSSGPSGLVDYKAIFPDGVADGGKYDLRALAGKIIESNTPAPRCFLGCGTDDFLYGMNTQFVQYLDDIGYPVEYVKCPGGHEWRVWDFLVERFLEWLPDAKQE
ncbi:MAG: esterase family protein [Clostridiales bacterium]|jgi:S-formylglutathione hydrolase FrmB|nr:esterase family protein [Clostridiales bacterium]MDR2751778.1 esterase family protein [Clostridiales bacterium]